MTVFSNWSLAVGLCGALLLAAASNAAAAPVITPSIEKLGAAALVTPVRACRNVCVSSRWVGGRRVCARWDWRCV